MPWVNRPPTVLRPEGPREAGRIEPTPIQEDLWRPFRPRCFFAFSPQGIGLPADALGLSLATLRAAKITDSPGRFREK